MTLIQVFFFALMICVIIVCIVNAVNIHRFHISVDVKLNQLIASSVMEVREAEIERSRVQRREMEPKI